MKLPFTWNSRWVAGATAFLALIFSSQAGVNPLSSTGHEVLYLAPEWSSFLSWQKNDVKNKNQNLFFSSRGFGLTVNQNSKPSYLKLNNKNKLVMVSASRFTVIGRQLLQHPYAVAVFSDGSYYEHVLMNLPNEVARDSLAQLAHDEIGMCGAMLPVLLDTPLTTLGDATAPTWSTTVKLSVVKAMLDSVSSSQIQSTITALEGLGTRFHSGANATTAVSTVKTRWQANLPSGATIAETSNGSSSTQNNLVLTLPGASDDSTTLIVGAHLDSINRSDLTSAPGADDDASGIATLTEMLRVIKASNVTFSRRIEFHAYGAEEVGLIGSDTLAKSYAAAGRKVAGMLQMDMNAYASSSNKDILYLVTTDTSPVLRRQLKDLMGAYELGSFAEMALTAGTSDHRSWMSAGFHAVFPFEHPQQYNKAIHSTADVSSLLDPTLSAKFGKLAIAWLAHHAGVVGMTTEHQSGIAALTSAGEQVKLATGRGSSSGHRFTVAAPSTTESISSCVVASSTATGCLKTPQSYAYSTTRGAKVFHAATDDQDLAAGELHRFVAYDAKGVAIAQRTVKLGAK